MAETKTVKQNYTAEQTTELVAAYVANPTAETVKTWAEKLGKNVRSVTQKLVREGVYKKPEYTTKKGEKPVKKEELADQFMAAFNLTEAEAESLAKANKTALLKILSAFNQMAMFDVAQSAD